jgi:hypothetical protein
MHIRHFHDRSQFRILFMLGILIMPQDAIIFGERTVDGVFFSGLGGGALLDGDFLDGIAVVFHWS